MEKYGLDQRYTPESLIANFLGQNFRGVSFTSSDEWSSSRSIPATYIRASMLDS